LTVVVLLGFITGTGQYVQSFLFGLKPAESIDIGEGVLFSSDEVPDGIRAAKAGPSITLPPDVSEVQFGEYLTPILDIGPSGPLPAPATLTFAVSEVVTHEDVALVFTSPDGSPDSWEIVQAEILPDGLHVRIPTEHFSYYQVYTPRAGQTARQFTTDVYAAYNNFAQTTPNYGAQDPDCDRERTAVSDGYTVESSDGDTALWCIGMNGNAREIKFTNNRNYPFELKSDGGLRIISNGGNDYGLATLATLGAEIVFPGKTAIITVDGLNPGQRGAAWTQLSDAAVGLKMAQVIVEIIVAFMTGGRSIEAMSKANLTMQLAVKAAECIEGLSARSLEPFLVKCFKDIILREVFGASAAKMFGFVDLAVKAYQGARAVFDTIRDVGTSRAEFRLTVSRAAGITRFVGTWSTFNGGELAVRADGTVSAHQRVGGDCAEQANDCTLFYELSVEAVDGGQRLVGTYTDVWYADFTTPSQRAEIFAFYIDDEPAVGNRVELRIGSAGQLQEVNLDLTFMDGDLDGDGERDSIEYCRDSMASSDIQAVCGS
jgi:hypothetical protein